jgi:hypothetical protein
MNIRRSTVIVLLALAALGPAFAGAGPVGKVSLEEVLAIGGLRDAALLQWTGVSADAAGNIYVLDALDFSLKKFGPDGRLLKKAGRKGQGPGEFMAPRLLAGSGSRLYATDQNVFGIYEFDSELRFIRKIPCPALVLALRALADGNLAAAVVGMPSPAKLLVMDGQGRLLSEFPLAESRDTGLLMDSASFALDRQGQFYIAYLFRDRVEKRTRDGQPLWGKSFLGQKTAATTNVQNLLLPKETCFKDVAVDAFGHVFVLGGKLSKNPSRDVYVLDANGALLTTFTLPEPSHCLYIDGRNYLYARADEGLTLKKYRIFYD